jgi:hypothetical protein
MNNSKCPPGVICHENMTMVFIILLMIALIYYLSKNTSTQVPVSNEKIIIKEREMERPPFNFYMSPNYPYNNLPADVLLNPYVPPLSDERYMVPGGNVRVPINVQTNLGAVDTTYRQMGLLTPLNGSNKILPLMGRVVFVNRDTWQYYTMSDQNNSVKLPVVKNGKSCTNEYGCDRVYSGDTVYVEGYNQAFKVTIYDSDVVRYLPF